MYVTEARKDPSDYWKTKMSGEPMPKAIADILLLNHLSGSTATGSDHFIRDFKTKPNVIIYHSHHVKNAQAKSSLS